MKRHATPKMATEINMLFVSCLSTATTKEELKGYFGQFGPIEEAKVIVDKLTKRNRGYGFVTFKLNDSIQRVFDARCHKINGKIVECQRSMSYVPKSLT